MDITTTKTNNEFEQIAVFKKDDLPSRWYQSDTEALSSLLAQVFGVELVRLLDPDEEYDYALFKYVGA